MGTRAACIDIGSNTTRLLVADCADGRVVEVHQERAFTRIGAGRDAAGAIAEAKIAETVAVVERQLASAARLGAAEVRGVATAAVRDAANGAVLVEAVRRRTGLTVTILSGEAEARLAFLGAAGMHDEPCAEPLGVIDVGGGSSEVVVGTPPAQVLWWRSLPIGSSALTERWLHHDPPAPAELLHARAVVAEALRGLAPPRPGRVLAVGGSATSLSRVAGVVLDAAALERSLAVVTAEPAALVARRFDIDPQRARLLAAALLILHGAAELLDAPVAVGRGGIREGVLLQAVRS